MSLQYRQASVIRLSSVVVNIFKWHLLWSHEANSRHISHIASIGRGTNNIIFCPNWIRTLVAMAIDLWWEKNENWHLLLSHCRYFDKRNIPWVVLYKTYLFHCNLLTWLVTMATKRQNLRKNIKNQLFRSCLGNKAELFLTIATIKILFFIAVAQALWLQLKVSIALQWEKWKLRFVAISVQIFWQTFYRNVCWVVVHQVYHFRPNLSI